MFDLIPEAWSLGDHDCVRSRVPKSFINAIGWLRVLSNPCGIAVAAQWTNCRKVGFGGKIDYPVASGKGINSLRLSRFAVQLRYMVAREIKNCLTNKRKGRLNTLGVGSM
jgi:hypothetical protein